jgi:hypothetical protein
MDWTPVSSSNLSRVRYDENSSTLEIEFQGGRIYQYFDVPKNIFDGLLTAGSHGQFFHEQIKGHFRYSRV